MTKSIDYGNLMHHHMRKLIQQVLEGVAQDGLPGGHHFFITFDTLHPEVEIADWLSDRYPGEMTVVLQNWFDNLEVTDEGFAITLNFGNSPEPLYIPWLSIKTFVDPSVEFGLRFEAQSDEGASATPAGLSPASDLTKVTAPAPKDEDKTLPPQKDGDAEIVSLDSFRKP